MSKNIIYLDERYWRHMLDGINRCLSAEAKIGDRKIDSKVSYILGGIDDGIRQQVSLEIAKY